MPRRRTTKEFIEESNINHNSFYDYSETVYKNKESKVKIICPRHGMFEQIPHNHLRGVGCPTCGIEKRAVVRSKGKSDFVKESKSRFGKNTFDYSLVKYINNKTRVKIKCNKHDIIFETNPKSHLGLKNKSSNGCCPKCHEDIRSCLLAKTKEKFIEDAILIHGNKYNYSKVDYINNKTKVCIICKEHGEFWQEANSHLSGFGCKECTLDKFEWDISFTRSRWVRMGKNSNNYDSYKLYKIKCWNEYEKFYKIGITFNKLEKRFGNKYDMPYNYEIIELIESDDGNYIWNLEKELHKVHKKQNLSYVPKLEFGGMYECFSRLIYI